MIKEIIFATVVLFSLSLNTRGVERAKKWHEDASFWTSFICSAKNSRSFGIYQIYTYYSYRLREFVKRLTPNLYKDCQSLLYLRTYKIHSRDCEDGKLIIRQTRYPRESRRAVIKNSINLKVPVDKVNGSAGSHLIDTPGVTVVLTDSEESLVGFLNHVVPEEWNNKMKFLIIMITDNSDSTQVENPERVADNVLKRLWRERQILNVIFVAPFATLGSWAFTYNPILSFAGQDVTGDIEILKFESSEEAATTMAKIYARNLKNLNGYPLKIGMFERIPTSLRLVDKDHNKLGSKKKIKFTGIDGIMLNTLARAMNFTTVIYGPTDGIEFGYQMQNGTYVGTLGDIVSKKIDVSFNAMFIKVYGNNPNAIRFSSYVSFDKLCLVVPKASKIPQWLRIFQSFTPTLWMYLGIVQIICGATWYIIQRRDRPSKVNFLVVLLDTVLIFAGAPRNLPLITSARILTGSLLLLSVTITGIFNGSLYKSFTTDSYYKDINELKEVDESGLQIGTGSPSLRDLFGSDDDSQVMINLRKKFNVISSSEMPAIERTAYLRNFAAVDRENDLVLRLHTKYIDNEGNHMLHIVPECPRTYFLAYAGQGNSIFFERINVVISRVMEAGLSNYWYTWAIENYLQTNSTRQFIRMQQSFVVFHLYDVQTSFFILAIGLSLSLLVFVGEHAADRRVEIYFKIRQWSFSIFNIARGTERRTYA